MDERYIEAAMGVLECLDRNIQKVHNLKYAFAQETAIRQRLYQIDTALMDYFISWDRTKRLLQEQAKLHEKLRELGFEP